MIQTANIAHRINEADHSAAMVPVTGNDGPDHKCAVDSQPPATFDRHLADFEDACVDQSHAYKLNQWPGRTSTLLAVEDNKAIGGAVVVLMAVPFFRRGVAHVRFGPFWRRRGIEQDGDAYRSLVKLLIGEYADRRGHLLTILPRPSPNFSMPESELLQDLGFAPVESAGSRRYFVDLTLDRDRQMESLGQKWRYNLRKSLAAGLSFREQPAIDAHRVFKHLHDRMTARKKAPVSDDLALINPLIQRPPAGQRPRFFFAYADGQPVAGAMTLALGDTVSYVFGASDDRALPLKAGYFLQWHILGTLAGGDARYYDLGGDLGADGLRQFKSGLAGRYGAVIPMPGEFAYRKGTSAALFGTAVQTMRRLKRSLPHR